MEGSRAIQRGRENREWARMDSNREELPMMSSFDGLGQVGPRHGGAASVDNNGGLGSVWRG